MIINGTDIYMTRGDSESVTVCCPERPFAEGDKVELTVRRYPGTGRVLLHKEVTAFPEGKAVILFAPEDTAHLPFCTASYDVQVSWADGTVKTIIPPSGFTVGKENTYAE